MVQTLIECEDIPQNERFFFMHIFMLEMCSLCLSRKSRAVICLWALCILHSCGSRWMQKVPSAFVTLLSLWYLCVYVWMFYNSICWGLSWYTHQSSQQQSADFFLQKVSFFLVLLLPKLFTNYFWPNFSFSSFLLLLGEQTKFLLLLLQVNLMMNLVHFSCKFHALLRFFFHKMPLLHSIA